VRILWLKTELLHPIDKGGKIRTYQMLKELKKNHHITYLTLDDGTAEGDALVKSDDYAHETIVIPHRTAAKFTTKFYLELASNLVSKLPYFMQKYVSKPMRDEIVKRANRNNFDVVICDFLSPAVNMPEDIEIPVILFQHNVESVIWHRHFEVQKNALKKAYLKNQWKKSVVYERDTCRKFDFVVAVSREDAEMMRRDYEVEKIADVATGVDTEFFTPDKTVEKDEFNVVFTGSMDWLPNEDGIRWFTEEVYPIIKQKIPQVSLTIVGRNPFPSLLELGKKDSSIIITGRVPDVRPFMDRAAVSVAPLRIAGGTRLKVYESMAMELPMVATTIGAEGLPVRDGKEILLRDSAPEFADAVVLMLTEKGIARKIGLEAAKTVREKFGWQKVADDFGAICERVIKKG
jgi:glycosyltransferase involved in cell wall biosynthesis